MIVPMAKVYIAASRDDRDRLLEALRALGVVHIVPVEPEQAVPDEHTASCLDTMRRAEQILALEEPHGAAPDLDPLEAAEDAVRTHRRMSERNNRLTSLYRQVEQITDWGDTRLEQLRALQEEGLAVRAAFVDAADRANLSADALESVRQLDDGRWLVVGVWGQGREPEWPEDAQPVEWPQRDRPSILAEAQSIDEELRGDAEHLGQLARLIDPIRKAHAHIQARADFVIAQRAGLEAGELYAIQGWVPGEHVDSLATSLQRENIPSAVERLEPDEDEKPPTLIRYPKWAKPIKALFDILGTTPGYREYDIAPFFMLAMPIFTAMLVGDAGYGLVFTIVGALTYGRLVRHGKKPAAQMILVFAIATVIWGSLSGNFFGVSPHQMKGAGGFWAAIGSALAPLAVLWRPESQGEEGRNLIMQISFIIGAIHLSLAHLRQAIGLLPDQRGIAEIGWVGFILGMFTLVWLMFFGPLVAPMATLWLLVGSWGLIILFASPSRNPVKRLVFGILGNLMSIPGAFGDMLSYIRLMAVGLASYYIASAFNDLGANLASATPWVIPLAVLVILFAHLLNIGLCLVAIFAHGVRLNMLEFSTNAGVQWEGYPYAPFREQESV